MSQDDRYLPGSPSKRLIRDVRRHLSRYGIRPTRFRLWQFTWQWADRVAQSYSIWLTRGRRRWPMPAEIAAQYLMLLLAQMQADGSLKLPFRAKEKLTAMLSEGHAPQSISGEPLALNAAGVVQLGE